MNDLYSNKQTFIKENTVFPHIVSAETILFWLWPYVLWPLVTVHKCAETIQGRKLFKGGNYMRKYGTYIIRFDKWITFQLINYTTQYDMIKLKFNKQALTKENIYTIWFDKWNIFIQLIN